jgi:hypothetical protein
MCEKYINIHIKCNVSSTCNILNLFCVEEYVGGLGQLFCFPRKIVKFPIHFCLVYYTGSLQSMATVKYLENGFSENLEIW